MSYDTSTLPFSPTLVLAAAGFAALSAFVTGPEIARREIERSNWSAICEAELQADLEATRTPQTALPERTDCRSLMSMFDPQLGELCGAFGNVDLLAPAREAERAVREAEEVRIRRVATRSGSRCDCAEFVYIEEERLALALYAGSVRLIEQSPIRNRQAALSRSLNSAACNFGQGS